MVFLRLITQELVILDNHLGDFFLGKSNSPSLSSPYLPAAFHLGVVPEIFPPSILLCQLTFKQFLMHVLVYMEITELGAVFPCIVE